MSTPPVPPADSGVPPHGSSSQGPHRPGARHPDDAEHDPTGIRALLSALPDPGPMPPDLVARISASIAQEQSARQGGTVVPLRRRTWGWQHLGAAAAAAVVLAVGLPALLTGTGPGDVMASLQGSSSADSASSAEGDTGAQADSGGAPAAPGPTVPRPTTLGDQRVRGSVGDVALAATGTAYTTAGLATQAAALGTTFEASSAAKDTTVPSGEAGLRSCLTALGVQDGLRVRGDVATLDGVPAVIALVDRGGTESVYAVAPDCDAQHPRLLAGPLTLP
ncbi:hypothetical protein [Pedococcus bigeumensis]|uniref:hypothetical protein n=1 Tax=Pedococcus bigeumensis TaxID=433644 RepID=UPI0031CFCFAB